MYNRQRRGLGIGTWPLFIFTVLLTLLVALWAFLFFTIGPLSPNNRQVTSNIFYEVFSTVAAVAAFIANLFFSFQNLITSRRLQEQQVQLQTTTSPSPVPRGILAIPPSTDLQAIQQREVVVRTVYENLIKPDAVSIVLTGLIGSGKSQVAALVCEYTKKQGQFTKKAIWVEIDQMVTISDIAVTVLTELNIQAPNFGNLTPQGQAALFINLLNKVTEKTLIVIDQFDRLLDAQTGKVLAEHIGIGEWLDGILSFPCVCPIILTSRFWPQGPRQISSNDRNTQLISHLENIEAKQLLQLQGINQGVNISEDEIGKVLSYCNNHPLALYLLASHLNTYHLGIFTFFNDPDHIQIWKKKFASYGPDGGFDGAYYRQLTPIQQILLLAFSIFRKPVPRDAIQDLINFTAQMKGIQVDQRQILADCEVFLRLNFLQVSNPFNYFHLHPVVAFYARDQFNKDDEDANETLLQKAHARAAEYFIREAENYPNLGVLPPSIIRLSLLIEAVWHQCQAGQKQKAYSIIESGNIISGTDGQSLSKELLELYQIMLPTKRWHPKPLEKFRIYKDLGDICSSLGNNSEANDYYTMALNIAKEQADNQKELSVLDAMNKLNSS